MIRSWTSCWRASATWPSSSARLAGARRRDVLELARKRTGGGRAGRGDRAAEGEGRVGQEVRGGGAARLRGGGGGAASRDQPERGQPPPRGVGSRPAMPGVRAARGYTASGSDGTRGRGGQGRAPERTGEAKRSRCARQKERGRAHGRTGEAPCRPAEPRRAGVALRRAASRRGRRRGRDPCERSATALHKRMPWSRHGSKNRSHRSPGAAKRTTRRRRDWQRPSGLWRRARADEAAARDRLGEREASRQRLEEERSRSLQRLTTLQDEIHAVTESADPAAEAAALEEQIRQLEADLKAAAEEAATSKNRADGRRGGATAQGRSGRSCSAGRHPESREPGRGRSLAPASRTRPPSGRPFSTKPPPPGSRSRSIGTCRTATPPRSVSPRSRPSWGRSECPTSSWRPSRGSRRTSPPTWRRRSARKRGSKSRSGA